MELLVKNLFSAYNVGSVVLFVSAALMVIVFILNAMFGDHVPSKFKPLFASVLGVVSAVAVALTTGVEWYLAIAAGLLLGTSAGGHWSLWGKFVCNVLDPSDHLDLDDDD
jgi:hypothetical protein